MDSYNNRQMNDEQPKIRCYLTQVDRDVNKDRRLIDVNAKNVDLLPDFDAIVARDVENIQIDDRYSEKIEHNFKKRWTERAVAEKKRLGLIVESNNKENYGR